MITNVEYQKTTNENWKGVRVRSLRVLKNGWAELPAGTVFTIKGKFSGFELQSDPCNCCKVRIWINKVPPSALERV